MINLGLGYWGHALIPTLDFAEPLKVECQHFVECIRTNQRPLTDGASGLQVVEVLEAAQRALEANRLREQAQLGSSLTSGGNAREMMQ